MNTNKTNLSCPFELLPVNFLLSVQDFPIGYLFVLVLVLENYPSRLGYCESQLTRLSTDFTDYTDFSTTLPFAKSVKSV